MVPWSNFRQTVGVILGPRSGGPGPGAGLAHFNNFRHLGHQQHGPGREHADPASSSGYQVDSKHINIGVKGVNNEKISIISNLPFCKIRNRG